MNWDEHIRGDCPPKLGGQRDRSSDHAGCGSKAELLKYFALEPPRRFAPPLLTQEGSRTSLSQFILTFIDRTDIEGIVKTAAYLLCSLQFLNIGR